MCSRRKSVYSLGAIISVTGFTKVSIAALLGVMLAFPTISGDPSGGGLSYSAGLNLLAITASPVNIRLCPGAPSLCAHTINPTGFPPSETIGINVLVDNSGNLIGGTPGNDLVVNGEVDIDNNGTVDYAGTLLTGEVAAFGYQDTGTTTDNYDFRFYLTGGLLASYFTGKDIGVLVTSEGSNFTGTFATDISGNAKPTIGAIPKINHPPHCNAGADYGAECTGTVTTVHLDGSASTDDDNDTLTYSWTTDCPNAVFDDATSATPTLTVDSSPGCNVACHVTLTVNDGHDSANCSADVTIVDTHAPTLTCDPVDVTIPCGEPTDTDPPVAHDDCDPHPTVTSSDEITAGNCDQSYTITRTWTATDACDNSASCIQTIHVVDNTPPTFDNCSASTTDLGCNPTDIPGCDDGVTATDDCGPATVTCDLADTSVGCRWTRTLTYNATDACGNHAQSCIVTYNWTATTPPVFDNCTTGGELGCNPTPPVCDTTITAHNECGPVTVTCSPGEILSDGCHRTQIFTYSATGCGQTSTCAQTFTWTVASAPVFDNCIDGTLSLGCNPTPPSCDSTITAHNECGPVEVHCAAGDVQADGCRKSQSFTYTASACGLSSTCVRSFTWIEVHIPPILHCPLGHDLGTNPDPSTLPTADTIRPQATADDDCDPHPTIDITFLDSHDGCHFTRVFTLSARDLCGNTSAPCTVTFTWTEDHQGPTVICPQGYDLGCNPPAASLPTCDSVIPHVIATDGTCAGSPTVHCEQSDSDSGCVHTRKFTFTATDSAGNTSEPCTTIYTWSVATAPTFDNCTTGSTDLGCNPTTPPACGTVTAHNQCGPVPVTCTAGQIQTSGCNRSQTFTYTATGCGLTSTCARTFTWTVVTAPVFSNCGSGSDLGCNPSSIPTCSTASAVTAHNECGSVPVTCAKTDTTNGCHRTRVLTYTATACGLTSTKTRTYTWTVVTTPVFDNCTGGTTSLGCNPTSIPSCGSGPAVTAHNECGSVSVCCTQGCDTSSGCNRSRTITYKATGCGLSATCTKTYTWTVTSSVPVFDTCTYGDICLGCDPSSIPTCATAPAQTAHNYCGPVPVTCTQGADVTSGCNRTRKLTYTASACGQTATRVITYTWTVVTTPVFDNCTPGTDLGCNPCTIPTCCTAPGVTAHNECGSVCVTCTQGNDVSNGCHRSRTLTYKATGCGLSATCTRTYTWTRVTAPVLDNLTPGTNLGCNPTSIPTCSNAPSVTAHNECGPVTVTCSQGADVSSCGCNRSRTLTYTATACGLTTCGTRTYSWTVTTAPVFDNCTTNISLGCNPSSIPTCATAPTVTAHNECGTLVVSCSQGVDVTTGCMKSRTLTYTATACGLTGTRTRVYTWSTDSTPPSITCPPAVTVLCTECTDLTKTGSATATDNCDPHPTITYTDTVTGTCPKTITRTWKAKDTCGNQVTCNQTISCIASRPCPRSPGYWKTHQSAWPATSLRVGCVTYTSTQLMNLLSDKEPGGSAANSDMSAILAKFVISATFDLMVNSDPQNIQSVLSSANTWLTTYPPGTNPTGSIKTAGENIKNQLDTYVNSSPSGCTSN